MKTIIDKKQNLRNAALKRRVFNLSNEGYTTNEIAELVGKTSNQIKSLREIGERHASIGNQNEER